MDVVDSPLAGDVGEGSRLMVGRDEVFEKEPCFLLFSSEYPQGRIGPLEVEDEITAVFLRPVTAEQVFDERPEDRLAFDEAVGIFTCIDIGGGMPFVFEENAHPAQVKADLGLLYSVDDKEEPVLIRGQVVEGFQCIVEFVVVRVVVDFFLFRLLEKSEDGEDQKKQGIGGEGTFFLSLHHPLRLEGEKVDSDHGQEEGEIDDEEIVPVDKVCKEKAEKKRH